MEEMQVYVGPVAMTKSYKKASESLVQLICEPIEKITPKVKKIGAIYVSVQNPSRFAGQSNIAAAVASELGLKGISAADVGTASNAQSAFHAAYRAVKSGYVDTAVAAGAEKMSGVKQKRCTRILAEVIDKEECKYGLSMFSTLALLTSFYMNLNDIKPEEMQTILENIAVRSYYYASLNPKAQFYEKRTTRSAYETKNRIVATPLRFFDCCPISDGAAAVVLQREETDIVVSGIGSAIDSSRILDRTYLDRFQATSWAAEEAYGMAGIRDPTEIEGLFVEHHDAFGILYLFNLVDLGLIDRKKVVEFFKGKGKHDKNGLDKSIEKLIGINGKIPVNISGGLKAGHFVGGTSVAKIAECCEQMRGYEREAELRIPNPKTAICHGIGGPGTVNSVTVLDRVDNHRRRYNATWTTEPPQQKTDYGNQPGDKGVIEGLTSIPRRYAAFPALHFKGFDRSVTIAVVRSNDVPVLANPKKRKKKGKIGDKVKIELEEFEEKKTEQTIRKYVYY